MKIDEAWFSKTLRKKCSSPNVKFYSFEWGASQAVPDLYFVARSVMAGWIELKVIDYPGRKVPFRDGQQQWLREHAKAGGRGFVFIYVAATETIIIINGATAGANGDVTGKALLEAGAPSFSGSDMWKKVHNYLTPHRN